MLRSIRQGHGIVQEFDISQHKLESIEIKRKKTKFFSVFFNKLQDKRGELEGNRVTPECLMAFVKDQLCPQR